MLEILDGFSKRMEFIAIVDSITNRRNTSMQMEALFDENKMENLILSVLIYIMETTLTEEEECTIENIAVFVREVISNYSDENIDVKELVRYIIKDILQNKGQSRNYSIAEYSSSSFRNVQIRLIADKLNNDNKAVYELTKQGYNFLFRTKEVDDELGFKIEEIKLKMLIHKKKYKKAISKSKNLIAMLRNKQIQLNQFEYSLKNNINNISGEMYDNLVNNMYELLEEEYEEMDRIDKMIRESLDRIKQEEELTQNLDEKTKSAKKDIYQILKNVQTALKMQINLLTKCKNVKKLYLDMLKDAMEYSIVKTYNFQEEIIDKLEQREFESVLTVYIKLLRPLFMPRMNKTLNLNTIYDKQTKINDSKEDEYSVEQDTLEESELVEKRIQRRNEAHIAVISSLFEFAGNHKEGFDFKEFYNFLKEHELKKSMLEERLIFMEMLKLYDLSEIDIDEWKKETEDIVLESNGEFDLSYCLKMISYKEPNFYGIRKILIEKTSESISLEDEEIEMTNFKFNVYERE